MLDLKDFIHLPQLATLFDELAADAPGFVVVAGLEPRPLASQLLDGAFGVTPPSGRSMVFGIVARRLLAAHPGQHALVVAETRDVVRFPKRRGRVEYALVRPPFTFASLIEEAMQRGQAKILIVERLSPECVPLALAAAQRGMRVVAQLDTIFRGAEIARQLLDFGAAREQLRGPAWLIAVQRLPALCPRCKQPARLDRARRAELRRRCPNAPAGATYFQAGRCDECGQTGRQGDVAVFDVWRARHDAASWLEQPSVLPLDEYICGLAAQGHLPIDDVLNLEAERLQRTYRLLMASEVALSHTNATLHAKVTELEVANQVLLQQTEASISLQSVGHALITLSALKDLAHFVCQKAGDLCGADRAILYLVRPDDGAEILSVNGWAQSLVHRRLDVRLLFGSDGSRDTEREPGIFLGWPPGVAEREPDVEGVRLRAGLRVPLVAQQETIGLLIFHSTLKAHFTPHEVALLRAFAVQSALAIQRAALVDSLRDKIDRLEAAQLEIAKKERLERELELARQVQQSMLPKTFPLAAGFEFAARSAPARQVGGDLYDVFVLDADRFGIVIADVVDKGMPAALYMALTRSLLLAEARRERSPAVVLGRVHRLLLDLTQPGLFVTVCYGVLSDGRLTYARAGHDRPLLLRDGAATALNAEGSVLGLLESSEVQLEERQVPLQPGDRLVLYTDGLVDALGPSGESFGLSRLVQVLHSQRQATLTQTCNAVFGHVAAHQGQTEQFDDMTLLVAEVK